MGNTQKSACLRNGVKAIRSPPFRIVNRIILTYYGVRPGPTTAIYVNLGACFQAGHGSSGVHGVDGDPPICCMSP